jgi:hypothetical protein
LIDDLAVVLVADNLPATFKVFIVEYQAAIIVWELKVWLF